ncbi:MAG: hypothetical protein ACXABY_00800 [Candidatus Thorarchaeota archaeon]|jgi:hypothetical protein
MKVGDSEVKSIKIDILQDDEGDYYDISFELGGSEESFSSTEFEGDTQMDMVRLEDVIIGALEGDDNEE